MFHFSDHRGSTQGEFSVCQWFKPDAPLQDSEYEYVRRWVGAEEAVDAFMHYCQSVAAKLGWVTQVRLIDGLDTTNMEWIYEEGITFPPEYRGKLKP